jgi:hypothetical protein
MDRLWPFWDAVVTSTVGFSGIRLRNAKARPVARASVTDASRPTHPAARWDIRRPTIVEGRAVLHRAALVASPAGPRPDDAGRTVSR